MDAEDGQSLVVVEIVTEFAYDLGEHCVAFLEDVVPHKVLDDGRSRCLLLSLRCRYGMILQFWVYIKLPAV